MFVAADEKCPLPAHPVLAAAATALNAAGYWAEIVDNSWRSLYATDDSRLITGARVELAPYPLGAHFFGADRNDVAIGWRGGQFPLAILRGLLTAWGPLVLSDTPGGRDELRDVVDPRLHDLVDGLPAVEQQDICSFVFRGIYSAAGAPTDTFHTMVRLRDASGCHVGAALMFKPAIGMAAISRITSMGDLRHFDRMERFATPGRRPGAVLFADLESSSPLARRLSTASYFGLVRRLARAADSSVVEAGGLVGQHSGDGIVAFFIAEGPASESAAAHACISAARNIRNAVDEITARSDLVPADVVLRFGLHWGATSTWDRSPRPVAPR